MTREKSRYMRGPKTIDRYIHCKKTKESAERNLMTNKEKKKVRQERTWREESEYIHKM